MSNHIMIHVATLMQTLKTGRDVRETSQIVMIGLLARPSTKLLMGFKCTAIFCYMTTIQSHKLVLPATAKNENSLGVEKKFNPISSGTHVHLGTKLKVLISFFREKSNSLYSFIIFNFL